jgi:hypothetical protein
LITQLTLLKQPHLAIASIGPSGGAKYSFYVEGTADWNFTREELPTAAKLSEIGAKALQFGCLTMALGPGNIIIDPGPASFSKLAHLLCRTISMFDQHLVLMQQLNVKEWSESIPFHTS